MTAKNKSQNAKKRGEAFSGGGRKKESMQWGCIKCCFDVGCWLQEWCLGSTAYIKCGLGCFGQMNGNFSSCVPAEVVNYLVSSSSRAEKERRGLLQLILTFVHILLLAIIYLTVLRSGKTFGIEI